MTGNPRSACKSGYTLPEMLVVLVIGAMVAALSFPEMSHMLRRGRLEEAAGRLESALRLSRQKALSRRTHYRVTLSPGTFSYAVAFEDSSGAWTPDTDSLYVLPAGIWFEGDVNGTPFNRLATSVELLFEPRGTLSQRDAPLDVLVYNDRGDTMGIEMVRTGRVRSWRR